MQRRKYLTVLGGVVPLAGWTTSSDERFEQVTSNETNGENDGDGNDTETDVQSTATRDVSAVVGELIDGERIHLVVEGVERGADLGEFSEAGPGNEFLVVGLGLQNVADEFVTVSNLLQTRVRDDEDYQYDQTFAGGTTTNTFNDGQFAPGEVERGSVVFEIPEDSSGLELVFDFDVSIIGDVERATIDLESEADEVAVLEQDLQIDIFDLGDSVAYGDVEVTVNETRNEDSLGEFSDPEEGNEYVVVDIAITNETGEDQRFSTILQMTVKDGEGYTYQEDLSGMTSLDRAFDEGTPLADGETRRGELAYQVPVDRSPLYWVFEFELFAEGDKTFWQLS